MTYEQAQRKWFLAQAWLWSAGVREVDVVVPPLDALLRSEWSDEFERKLRRNAEFGYDPEWTCGLTPESRAEQCLYTFQDPPIRGWHSFGWLLDAAHYLAPLVGGHDDLIAGMRARLVQGAFRHGPMASSKRPAWSRIDRSLQDLAAYRADGDLDHIYDAANMCLLAWVEAQR